MKYDIIESQEYCKSHHIGVVKEGSNVHAEARIEPKGDSKLRVEWELNGKPVSSGSRLKTTLDFGHVTLNINGVRSTDSGIYTCKAINALGEAVSTTSIKVDGKQYATLVIQLLFADKNIFYMKHFIVSSYD